MIDSTISPAWAISNTSMRSHHIGFGNNYSVSDSNLYTLGLPTDVLNVVPTIVENAGMGEMPDFINVNPLSTVKDFAEAVFDFVVDCLEGLANLATRMVELGLEVIGELTSAVASAVEEFVDDVVDAFTAFVDWAVEYIQATIDTVFAPLVQVIKDQWVGYCQNVKAAASRVMAEIEGTGTVSPSAAIALLGAIHGDFYWALAVVAVLAKVVATAAQVATVGASFVAGYLVAGIAMVVINTALEATSYDVWDQGTPQYGVEPWQAWTYDIASDGGSHQVSNETAWALGAAAVGVFMAIFGVADLLYISTSKILSGAILADGIIALCLGLYSVTFDDPAVGVIGFFISVESIILSLFGATIDVYVGGISAVFGIINAGMSYKGCDWN